MNPFNIYFDKIDGAFQRGGNNQSTLINTLISISCDEIYITVHLKLVWRVTALDFGLSTPNHCLPQ